MTQRQRGSHSAHAGKQVGWCAVSDAVNSQYYAIDPMFMVIPGLAIFLTVMAFNLFGDGLRDALDPRSSR